MEGKQVGTNWQKNWMNKVREMKKDVSDRLMNEDNIFEAQGTPEQINAFGEEDKNQLETAISGNAVVVSAESPNTENNEVVWHVKLKDKKNEEVEIIFSNVLVEGFHISSTSFAFNNDSIVLFRQLIEFANTWRTNWLTRIQEF